MKNVAISFCICLIAAEGLALSAYGETNNAADTPSDIKALLEKVSNGDANVENELGNCYYWRGDKEAAKWYRKSADQGYATAQCNLALCYEDGLGVPRNYVKAVKWYWKAAEQGNPDAKIHLRRIAVYVLAGIVLVVVVVVLAVWKWKSSSRSEK